MGWTSEMVAEHYDVSRETQDKYALISHTRANEVNEKSLYSLVMYLISQRHSAKVYLLMRSFLSN
jgi:acetyl-CoA acetyltransferase